MKDERSILRHEAGPISIDFEESPQLVWRFVRFRECFSPEGTEYLRIPIEPLNDDQADYLFAMKQLKREPNCMWLQGAVMALLRRLPATEQGMQGYLVDATGQSVSTSAMSSRLGLDVPVVEAMLAKFKDLGLLEQVELPLE
ncbi:MAG: hypothetical protein GY809_21205 [Planctomycetes bacterium]|nr:hypothetical protein [Planctomycetota bacterium]